jgi:NAD(P)-dependent dehydrogenase (short-subunit alcohol dehydrogenase family)
VPIPTNWKVIWITGASSGIGRELALKLAAAGAIVAVSARSAQKIAELEALNPNIKPYPLDVTDLAACKATAAAIERDLGPIDLAIMNAGVWIPMDVTTYDPAGIAEGMAVNFTGIINALAPLIPAMIARKSGHIALVSSVAGYRGLPMAIAYAPTKAAVISLAETLYLDLRDRGVTVTVINPGFVDTPMTKVNTFPMPFMITAEDAANRIIRGLAAGAYEIVFPLRMKLLAKFTRLMPNWAFFAFIKAIPSGEAAPSQTPPPRPPPAS